MATLSKRLLVASTLLATMATAAAGGIVSAAPDSGMPQTLDCRAALGSAPVRWEVEFHDSLPLAVVDGDDAPAAYAASHATVRLAAGGPSLLIGRVTGRMVISDSEGRTLGKGLCIPSSATHEPSGELPLTGRLPPAAFSAAPHPKEIRNG